MVPSRRRTLENVILNSPVSSPRLLRSVDHVMQMRMKSAVMTQLRDAIASVNELSRAHENPALWGVHVHLCGCQHARFDGIMEFFGTHRRDSDFVTKSLSSPPILGSGIPVTPKWNRL